MVGEDLKRIGPTMKPVSRRTLLQYAGLVAAAQPFVSQPLALAYPDQQPIAATRAGKVLGRADAGIFVFQGIPYGADTRTTRFRPPVPPAPWKTPLQCTAWPARAPQQQADRGARVSGEAEKHYHLPPDLGPQREDCLHVNVWTPGLRDGRKRPVLFYIHGGAYNNGTVNAELYDGARLARRGDVVVVTVNHRLNAFGYLYLGELAGPEYKDSGNVGQLDLVLALQWVRDNIAEFGGDPGSVTIFGQSGGGAKCATLMAMPAAKGLFHRVLTMSGQQVWAAPKRLATERAKAALAAMGITGEITAAKLDALTMEQVQKGAPTTGAWLPVMDGGVLPRDPFDPDAPPQSLSVPMILGNTKDELQGGNAWRMASLTWEQLPAQLGPALKEFMGPYTPEAIVKRYRELYPAYQPVDVFIAATAAFRSGPGQVIEAERRAANPESAKRTWVYQMDYGSPTADGRAPHTIDIAFVFDNLKLSPGMIGATEADIAAAQPLATLMSTMLIRFAKTGDPNGAGMPKWPTYDLKARSTMLFDRVSKVQDDPRGEERRMVAEAHYRQPGTA